MNEVCPSCGDFVDYLGEMTGWCHDCEVVDGVATAKPCLGCGVVKTLEEFPPHQKTIDGRRGKCRKCATKQRLAWRTANRERDNQNWRRHYARRVARRLEQAS